MNIQVRIAKVTDLDALLKLNQKWQIEKVGVNKGKGFLSLAFEKEELFQIIKNKEIVVGVNSQEEIVGYCSVNNYSKIIPKFSGKKVKELKTINKISENLGVALGAQILLELEYRGNVNRKLLLATLIQNIKSKYDLMWTSVVRDNNRILRINLLDGWELVDEDDKHHYLTLELNNNTLPINKVLLQTH